MIIIGICNCIEKSSYNLVWEAGFASHEFVDYSDGAFSQTFSYCYRPWPSHDIPHLS